MISLALIAAWWLLAYALTHDLVTYPCRDGLLRVYVSLRILWWELKRLHDGESGSAAPVVVLHPDNHSPDTEPKDIAA